jgi:hypothetical protein
MTDMQHRLFVDAGSGEGGALVLWHLYAIEVRKVTVADI